VDAAWIALIGVVIAGVLSFFTARYTARKALEGVNATNQTKQTEIDQGYVKWACDMVTAGSPSEAEYGVGILRGLKAGQQLGLQDRLVVQSVLKLYTQKVTQLMGDQGPSTLAQPATGGEGGEER
jgi:hypothetical protein